MIREVVERKISEVVLDENIPFFTSKSIKRELSIEVGIEASRKRIISIIRKKHRLYWGLSNPIKPINQIERDRRGALTEQGLGTLRLVAATFGDPNFELIFVDECKFPLDYIPYKAWRSRNQKCKMVRPDSEESSTLTAIAACTPYRYLSLQIFQRDLTQDDFLYFLHKTIRLVELEGF